MIADLHCHYPMHLLPEDHHPLGTTERWWERLKDDFDARAVAIAGHFFNNPHWWQDWRVDLDGLVAGDVQLACSVLLWPASEFRLGSDPAPGSFDYLRSLLKYVEQELAKRDPTGARHLIATQASDLDQAHTGRVVFIHCVEGGFHLGPDEASIDANVQWLAEQGVIYITVAHLFFKGVATNAPSIPGLTDAEYGHLFHQPDVGLTELGETLVKSMYKHKVLIDVSHMSELAIKKTFELIERLDKETGAEKEDFPVLAGHVGMASVKDEAYNLTDETAQRIHARGGLIGVIMAQQHLGTTADETQSQSTLKAHIEAIQRACGGFESCAIGTDIDGFIKPTLAGFEHASDSRKLADWITSEFPADAPAILHENALRVLKRVFEARDRAAAAAQAQPDAAPAAVPAADGYHHPASETELVALVKTATDEGLQLRVRGAAHSVSHAIYTDPVGESENTVSCQTPPSGNNINVMLDRYRGWRVVDDKERLIEADAGIHLGADPSDPTGTASLEASLLYQLWKQRGWTLSSLGGITHQSVSGFTATGSSGGSVQHSVNDNLWAFQVIDADGNVHVIGRNNPGFGAMAPNLGVLGVVSKITLKCEDAYNITGQEAISTVDDCAVDLFGSGSAGRPPLEQFLRETEYARVLWWPQRGVERVQVWQAQRITAAPGFSPVPYQEFTAHPDLAEPLISILLTVFGNLGDLSHAFPQLHEIFSRVDDFLDVLPAVRELGPIGKVLAKFLSRGTELGADAALELLRPFAPLIRHETPKIFDWLLGMFVPLDADKPGADRGKPQMFQDYAWHGLPMDDGADDVLLRVGFSEIWVPLTRTGDAMGLLRTYFDEPRDVHEAYRRTGLNEWELYAAKPTDFWLSASHATGQEGEDATGEETDQWSDGAFRIDAYWFAPNLADPVTFYEPVWDLFRQSDIPFRLHWGKYQPASDSWADFFKQQYPRWADFLKERKTRDPHGTFFTSYWQDRLK